MVTAWRWLLAAAVVPLVLAGCTSSTGPPGAGTRHGRSPGRVLLRGAGWPPAPVIIASPAYRDGGLIVITFDEGSGTAACCGENSGLGPSHPTAQSWTPTAWPAIPEIVGMISSECDG